MKEETSINHIIEISQQHGLQLETDSISLNESGMDFQVAFARDENGRNWILRIPRRTDVDEKVSYESKVLDLLKKSFSLEVPDWRILSTELIAYPMLSGKPIAVIDLEILNYVWSIDHLSPSPVFIRSLARAIAALHAVSPEKARTAGLKIKSPVEAREAMKTRIESARETIGVEEQLWQRWQAWLNNDACWPAHSVLIHGDLQAAHILVDDTEKVTGFIDWTEAEIADPATDFVPFLMAFGEEALDKLLDAYREAGGKTWTGMSGHIREMHAAYPAAIAEFALQTGEEFHMNMARQALGLS